ncbi:MULTISPECIES: hypothetical protein [Roseateles]|uniref:hypothetical protein n=1 Tax=Roseateles TaxID=93681 RepID=UPI001CBC6B00|nr:MULTISPECIES: hypothetical protein [Roseateles]WIV97662.1 hypothetical protein K9V56_022050 [Paucibacter aquatile]
MKHPRSFAPLTPSWPRARPLALLIALPLALLAGACSSAPASNTPESQRLLKSLEAEIGEARCSSDAQCHSLAVGAKACGGPEGYLAWSSQHSGDGKKLQALADQQAAARRAEQSQSGMMSNCALEADPGARCQAGRCTLRPRAAAGASAR